MPPSKKKAAKAAASPPTKAGGSSSSEGESSSQDAARQPLVWTGKSVEQLTEAIEELRREMHAAADPLREDYAAALDLQKRIAPLQSQLEEAAAARGIAPPVPAAPAAPIVLQDALMEEPPELEPTTAEIVVTADAAVEKVAAVDQPRQTSSDIADAADAAAAAAPTIAPTAGRPVASTEELIAKLADGHLLTASEMARLEQEPDETPIVPSAAAAVQPTPAPAAPASSSSWGWSPFSFFTDKDGDGIDDATGQSKAEMDAAAAAAATAAGGEPASAWAQRLETVVDAAGGDTSSALATSSRNAASSRNPTSSRNEALWSAPASASASGSIINVGAVARYASLVAKAQDGGEPGGPSPVGGSADGNDPPAAPTGQGEATTAAAPAKAVAVPTKATVAKATEEAKGTDPASPAKVSAAAPPKKKASKPPPKPPPPKSPTPRPKGMPSREWYLTVLSTRQVPEESKDEPAAQPAKAPKAPKKSEDVEAAAAAGAKDTPSKGSKGASKDSPGSKASKKKGKAKK